ncbi:hypothetical protein [Tepiditoga spiralis]|nr:hypothetical protein [Tepiditoga spiralis]
MIVIFPLFGKIADIYSLKIAFLFLAIFISALEIIIITKYSN